MEYVKQLLETHLRNEVIALTSAKELTKGNGMHFSNQTMKAFDESRRLAEERIPQLQKTLELIKKP